MLWPTINKFAFALLYLHVSGSESAEQKRGVRVHFRCHAVFIEIKNTYTLNKKNANKQALK